MQNKTASLLDSEKRSHKETLSQLREKNALLESVQQDLEPLNRLQGLLGSKDIEASVASLQEQQQGYKELQILHNSTTVKLNQLNQQQSRFTEVMDENRTLEQQVIRLEAKLEGIQLASNLKT